MFENINFWGTACLVLGMVLVGIEVFIPGFGIPGAVGIILLALSIVLTAQGLGEALILAAIMVVFVCVLVLIAVRSVASGKLSRTGMILRNKLSKEEGFSAVKSLDDLLGKEGICITPLRPAGTVQIEDGRFDVVSDLEFIETGERVAIVAVEGRRVVARRIQNKED